MFHVNFKRIISIVFHYFCLAASSFLILAELLLQTFAASRNLKLPLLAAANVSRQHKPPPQASVSHCCVIHQRRKPPPQASASAARRYRVSSFRKLPPSRAAVRAAHQCHKPPPRTVVSSYSRGSPLLQTAATNRRHRKPPTQAAAGR